MTADERRDLARAADHAARQRPVDLTALSTNGLLSLQAAYMLVPHEERSPFVHARVDEMALEVSERMRPVSSDLPALYAANARGDRGLAVVG